MSLIRKIPVAASLLSLATAALLSACVVAPAPRPAPVVYTAPVAAPVGVVVAPTYAIPGPGYVWAYHPHYGYGWYHPQRGWHRGWR